MQLIGFVRIKYLGGRDFYFAHTIDDLLADLTLEDDKEGFPGRHLNVGTIFTIPKGEYAIEGKFKVVGIYTFINISYQGEAGEKGEGYNFEIIYEVEDIK